MIRRLAYAFSVTAALLGVLVVPAAAPASAASYGCSIVVPAKVVVVSPYTVITAKTGADCGANKADWAAWDVRHSYYGPSNSSFFDGTSSESAGFYDWEHYGKYLVEPSAAYDVNSSELTQNTTSYLVKVGSKISLQATRSGSQVTMKVGATYYNPEINAYKAWQQDKVGLQYRVTGTTTWKWIATVTTDSTGHATHRFTSPTGRVYRAVSTETSTIWGRATA